MGTVVTTLEIDADTSGADVFTQAMNGAEQAAKNAVSSLAGLGAGFLAVGGLASAAIVAIKEVNGYFADMATVAHQVGLTLTEFQGVQFGGQLAGLNTDQINAGLEKSASLLNDASRNSNSLSKELDANGLSVKNANGQLISENQLLGIAANLIENAKNPGDELAIAQMLGFTKEWIPLLEQGGTAMSGLSAEAKAAGAVIDDATIQRAQEFDDEWRKSSVEWSAYMKAAVAGLLPYLDDLIDRAARFVKGIDVDAIEKAANKQLQMGADAVGLPDQAAVNVEMPQSSIDNWAKFGDEISDVFKSIKDFANDDSSLSMLDKLRGLLSAQPPSLDQVKSKVAGLMPSVEVMPQDDFKWYGGTGTSITDTSDAQNTESWLGQGAAVSGLQASVASAHFGKASKVASNDVANDAVDRALNSLEKHTQATLADANAVGLGDAALAAFKADAAETAAVMANGGKETDKQVDQFSDYKDAAIAAAGALAEMKVQSSIQFGTNTALLGSGDVAIATQLKGIYGNDVPAALASSEAAALKTNVAFKELSTGIENDLVGGLTDIVDGSKSASQGFSDMGVAIIKTIDQMIIKMLVVEPIMKSLQSILGFSSGPITLGTSSGPTPFPSAHGNAFDRGNVIAFAAGGVVDSPTIAPMALFGEAGPEAIVPLKRGSDGNLGIASSGGGGGGVSFGDINIQLPEGTSPENASAVGAAVKASMIQVIDQRLAYHSRPRGMLNSGT